MQWVTLVFPLCGIFKWHMYLLRSLLGIVHRMSCTFQKSSRLDCYYNLIHPEGIHLLDILLTGHCNTLLYHILHLHSYKLFQVSWTDRYLYNNLPHCIEHLLLACMSQHHSMGRHTPIIYIKINVDTRCMSLTSSTLVWPLNFHSHKLPLLLGYHYHR